MRSAEFIMPITLSSRQCPCQCLVTTMPVSCQGHVNAMPNALPMRLDVCKWCYSFTLILKLAANGLRLDSTVCRTKRKVHINFNVTPMSAPPCHGNAIPIPCRCHVNDMRDVTPTSCLCRPPNIFRDTWLCTSESFRYRNQCARSNGHRIIALMSYSVCFHGLV